MAGRPASGALRAAASRADAEAILNGLAEAVFVVDGADCLSFVNQAAEVLLARSAQTLIGRRLKDILPPDSPVFSLVHHARLQGNSVSESGLTLETPKIGTHFVTVTASPLAEYPGNVALSFQERSIARKIDGQLVHRNAARSVTAMAAMLAHELKNPLSGIRGAAQLLESNAGPEDRALTRLICEEADRIVALVDRMEMFTDELPLKRGSVNIHEVLGHVRRLAGAGIGREVRFVERYDPSLPPVLGNRDLLIQAVLNLVKNAVEAVPEGAGEVALTSSYRQGVRMAVHGGGERIALPMVISVQDNGPGIPEDLQRHLFEPFVTTKPGGKGLGLALVAKIIGDHGGIVEFESEPGRTVFSMLLPKAPNRVPGTVAQAAS